MANTIGIVGSAGNTFTDPGTYYDPLWLERLKPQLYFEDLGSKRPLPKNKGTLLKWRRLVKLTQVGAPPTAGTSPTLASYALTENTNPSETTMSTEEVTVQPLTYGQWVKVSSELKWKSINPVMEEFTNELADNAAVVYDAIVRFALSGNGTNQFAAGRANEAAVTSSDVLTRTEILKAVYKLQFAGVPGWENGLYKGVVHPAATYDIMADSAAGSFYDTAKYAEPDKIMRNEFGMFGGVRFVRGQNVGTGTGSGGAGTSFHTYIFGQKAFGITELSGEGMRMIRKEPGPNDTSNPLDMFSTVGWKFVMAAKVLQTSRFVQIYSGTGAA